MTETSIFIACPAFGSNMTTDSAGALFEIGIECTKRNIKVGLSTVSSHDITDIRNRLITYWYDKSPSTHLLFYDADIGFGRNNDTLFRMLDADKPLIGAIYPLKTYPIRYTMKELPTQQPIENGVMEVAGLPAGFMLIRRDCMDAIVKHYGDELLNPLPLEKLPQYNFIKQMGLTRLLEPFNSIVVEDGKLSEDFSFCHRYRQTGGKVFAFCDCEIRHVGYERFSANFLEIAKELKWPIVEGE